MKLNMAMVGVWTVLLLAACSPKSAENPQPKAPAAEQEQAASAPAETMPAERASPCDDAVDQRAMTACWGKEMRAAEERVDAALNKLGELFLSKRSPAAQQKLQEDQRRWLEFVAGHCGLYGELYEGGSASSMTVAVCRSRLAQTRLQQLTPLTEELDR